MNNKSKSWNDVQLIVSSFSIALTLGFWGLFASQEKTGTGVTGEVSLPTQPDPQASSSPPASSLLPGQKLLFGRTNLQLLSQQQSQIQAQPTPIVIIRKKHGGGGGGGGGGGSGGAQAGTGSSHP
jgi:hypothetical protein